jgi:glutamate dehydrogenase
MTITVKNVSSINLSMASWETLNEGVPTGLERQFLDLFLSDVAAEDRHSLRSAAFAEDVGALWRALVDKRDRQPLIVLRDSLQPGRVALLLLNEDRPFLVSSVTAAIARQGLSIDFIAHPVVLVVRENNNIIKLQRFSGIHPAEESADVVSAMLIYLKVPQDEMARKSLLDGVRQVLAAVTLATTDWPAMQALVRQHIDLLRRHESPVQPEEHAETVAFLEWLLADHFTLLGVQARHYHDPYGASLRIIPNGDGLGILRQHDSQLFIDAEEESAETLPIDIQLFLTKPQLLHVAKAKAISLVHRAVPLDVITLKVFDERSRLVGELRIVGLFTSSAYQESPEEIPFLRHKARYVMERSGLDPNGHDGKVLLHILKTLPRDDIYQLDKDELFRLSTNVLRLQERPRIALFLHTAPWEHTVSALVYLPREKFSQDVLRRIEVLLANAVAGAVRVSNGQVEESPLARINFVFAVNPKARPAIDHAALEQRLNEIINGWTESLRQALDSACISNVATALHARFGQGFPLSYQEASTPAIAAADTQALAMLYADERIHVRLVAAPERGHGQYSIRIFSLDNALPLYRVLPILENIGFRTMGEDAYEIKAADHSTRAWIHDFTVFSSDPNFVLGATTAAGVEATFVAVWSGDAEDDALNSLTIIAGLHWRQVATLRALAFYARQAGFAHSVAVISATLLAYPIIAADIAALFDARFAPENTMDAAAVRARLQEHLTTVRSLVEDSVVRYLIALVEAIWRTNVFQHDANGQLKKYFSFKINSNLVPDLPQPCPYAEIFVYAAYMEGIHLRGGKVARGGIRWSDRREDFRREVLGLIKAQMVKNAVIVPVGSKGGFVVKKSLVGLPREEQQVEVVRCYQTLIRGLLDITDNLHGNKVVPPAQVVRHDGDDPYLVVAADKGTATFSDIANALAAEYGFWLGDAFASGGSVGYDHKKMGITARGGWEAVKRHFRERGKDIQATPFTVAGVGDMSGDVFGNGMLLSSQIRLLAAFNHKHIFLDPNPDVEASFVERQRLFNLPASQWSDYNPRLISEGGGVFDRSAKTITVSPVVRGLLGTEENALTPDALIRLILGMDVELLWFGGIGTYVRANHETDVEVGDKTNDALRISASALKAKVIGEGANLGMTQKSRIEAAQQGVRLNTDAIDNSAGVDCSDHEVNIKILMQEVTRRRHFKIEERNRLLEAMTDEVAELVIYDNYLQTAALSLAEAKGIQLHGAYAGLMRRLEAKGKLNRALECLPDDVSLAARTRQNKPLTRPELAVLLAYAKMDIFDELITSKIPDEPRMANDLKRYFPVRLQENFEAEIAAHPLRREIIATHAANSIVNRCGIHFAHALEETSGAPLCDIVRAYATAREVFGLRALWGAIEKLDNKVPVAVQLELHHAVNTLVEHQALWFLGQEKQPLDVTALVAHYAPSVAGLAKAFREISGLQSSAVHQQAQAWIAVHVPSELSHQVAQLKSLRYATDIIRVAEATKASLSDAAAGYVGLAEMLSLPQLETAAAAIPLNAPWQAQARTAVLADLYEIIRNLSTCLLKNVKKDTVAKALEAFEVKNASRLVKYRQTLAHALGGGIDVGFLTLVNRGLRGLE